MLVKQQTKKNNGQNYIIFYSRNLNLGETLLVSCFGTNSECRPYLPRVPVVRNYEDMDFLQGMTSRRLWAHVSQRVKYHCMAQLRLSPKKRFSAGGKALAENRAQHKLRPIILCCHWSRRMKNYFSLIRNHPGVQQPSASFQLFSLATFNTLMWFACQVSAQLQKSINPWICTEWLEKMSKFCTQSYDRKCQTSSWNLFK